MRVNNYWFKKIIILYYFSYAIILIVTMPLLAGIFTLIQNNKVIFFPSTFEKRWVKIDSIYMGVKKGGDHFTIIGYSKELNNYNTQIIFGYTTNKAFLSYVYIPNKEIYSGNNIYNLYVWHNPNNKYAYPAKKEDKIFPVKSYLKHYLKFLPFWLILLLLNRGGAYVVRKYEKENMSKK